MAEAVERVEKRRQPNAVTSQSAPGQSVSSTATAAGDGSAAPGQELTGFEATLKKLDNYLGGTA